MKEKVERMEERKTNESGKMLIQNEKLDMEKW
jgi:hypothetical protein